MATILITGAAGRIGTAITPLLREQGHRLRLLDVAEPAAATSADEVVRAPATDLDAMTAAAAGVDLLVHLAAHASERTWRSIIDLNVESTRVALDAARTEQERSARGRNGTGPVVVLASSVHAAGYTPADAAGALLPPPRPDTYYGVSKVVGEALGSLYADRFGLRVVSARIMNFDDRPRSVRALSLWLSAPDLVRLLTAALAAPAGHAIVWGVSRNTRGVVNLAAGRAIGYEPVDDAEDHAAEVADAEGVAVADLPPLGAQPIGGAFTDPDRPIGTDWE